MKERKIAKKVPARKRAKLRGGRLLSVSPAPITYALTAPGGGTGATTSMDDTTSGTGGGTGGTGGGGATSGGGTGGTADSGTGDH